MTTEPTDPSVDGDVDAPSTAPAPLDPAPEPGPLELEAATDRKAFPRPVLAVAAVLAVVALGFGAFALTRGDDDTPQTVATEGAGVSSVSIWNSTWELVALERNGEPWEVASLSGDQNPQMTTTQPGREAISYTACNQGTGTATVEGDRLVRTDFMMTVMACAIDDQGGGSADAFMDQEVFVVDLLGDRPTIAITEPAPEDAKSGMGFDRHGLGDRLTLTTANGSATFERTGIGAPVDQVDPGGPIDPGVPVDPDGSVSSPPQPPGSFIDPGVVTTSQPRSPEETVLPSGPDGGPSTIWDRTWNVVTLTDGGTPRSLIDPTGDSSLRLEATTADATGATGHARFNGCNGAGGVFDLDGNRLSLTEQLDTSTMGRCLSDELMAQEAWLQAFMAAGPTVTIDGDRLTLATDRATIDLVAS